MKASNKKVPQPSNTFIIFFSLFKIKMTLSVNFCEGKDRNLLLFMVGNDYHYLIRNKFCVDFNINKWKRKSSEVLEKQIEDIWEEKCKECNIYNGKKFRYGEITSTNDEIILRLGLTCYKDMIGTSHAPNVTFWKDQAKTEYADDQAYMSNCLGVGVLTFTSDEQLVLIRRANWTAEYPGMIDRPGGHPEPDNVFHPDGSLKKPGDTNHEVADELWDSAIQELEAETGITRHQIKDQKLMGIFVNPLLAGRPSMEFLVSLNVKGDEVYEQYALQKHTEAEESKALILVSPDEVHDFIENLNQQNKDDASDDNSGPILHPPKQGKTLQEFTPALKGALALYSHHGTMQTA